MLPVSKPKLKGVNRLARCHTANERPKLDLCVPCRGWVAHDAAIVFISLVTNQIISFGFLTACVLRRVEIIILYLIGKLRKVSQYHTGVSGRTQC